MADRAFERDLRALRHDLEELQERLEDLGESGGDAAKSALSDMKGRLESRLAHVFSTVRVSGGGVAEAVGKGVAKASEYGGKRLLKKAEEQAKGAFHEVTHNDHDRGVLSAASIAVFGLGFAVGWLVARR